VTAHALPDSGPEEPLAATCPSCGEPAAAEDRFCEACGADLPTADLPTADLPTEGGCPCGGSWVHGYCDTCGDRQPDGRDDLLIDLGPVGAAASHVGHQHHRNEDAAAIGPLPTGGAAAVVCDGVSSTVDPHVVSQAAADAAYAQLTSDPSDLAAAHRAAAAAAAAVEFVPHPELGPPSATFLAATVTGGHVTVGGLGDCRAYWLPDSGGAVLVTQDHSWGTEQIQAGHLSEAQAFADPRTHSITRWMGRDAEPDWTPDVTSFDAAGPGLVLLCSDGLWNYVSKPQLLADLAGPDRSPAAVATRLVRFALDAGGHDNITVVALAVPAGRLATTETTPPPRTAQESP